MAEHPFKVGDKVRYKGLVRGRHHTEVRGLEHLMVGKTLTVRTAHWFGHSSPIEAVTFVEISPTAWHTGSGPDHYWEFVDNLEEFFERVPDKLTCAKDLEDLYE